MLLVFAGSTPVSTRQVLIDEFERDCSIPVFLLSTKAGGLGINLTAADTVVTHDLDFNPESDRQAEDRCHRIGQRRPVTVCKLVVNDTVENDIFEMGEKKQVLSKAVLSDEGGEAAGDRLAGDDEGRAADKDKPVQIGAMLKKVRLNVMHKNRVISLA